MDNNNIPRKTIRLDLDQPSNEVYQTCLSIPPRTFSIYDDQHEPVAELPLFMFWYDKIENTQATKSTSILLVLFLDANVKLVCF